jgi:hypothetical protein
MSAKNKPTYELFCKGIMNRKRKGLRFDENGNVVCEPKAEFGADVDVDGALTINSAKDLKTKDGTSFGGGLPSPWVANENVLGYEDAENQLVIGFLTEGGNLYGYQNKQSGEASYVSPASSGNPNIVAYINVNTQVESFVILPDDFVTKSQVINLGDINKKQSTLYRHTIDIDAGGLGLHTYVTALSEKNTVIDSIQDLVAVFGNTKLMATGQYSADSRTSALLEVGTSLTNTYVHDGAGNKTSLSNWASIGPNETYLKITDSVTAM